MLCWGQKADCCGVRGDAKMLKHRLLFQKLNWEVNKEGQRDRELVKDKCRLKRKFGVCLFAFDCVLR